LHCLASEAINLLHQRFFGGNVFVKIHIQKAFYTLDWNFLDRVLRGFGNNRLCAWIQTILHPAKLFIWVNGKVVGFFNCMREVR
jgi:hypothetical protein